MRSQGDMPYSCLTSLSILNDSFSPPFNLTQAKLLMCILWLYIHFHYLPQHFPVNVFSSMLSTYILSASVLVLFHRTFSSPTHPGLKFPYSSSISHLVTMSNIPTSFLAYISLTIPNILITLWSLHLLIAIIQWNNNSNPPTFCFHSTLKKTLHNFQTHFNAKSPQLSCIPVSSSPVAQLL